MTVGELGQLLTGLAALWAAVTGWRNGRKIDEVHRSTNGKMDQLVAEVRIASFAAGKQAEKDSSEQAKVP